MRQQVEASIRFELPLDPVKMAAALATVSAAWQQFSDAVQNAELRVHEQSFSMKDRNSQRPYRRKIALVKPGKAS